MADAATPKKILCIEDEHFISDLYSRALKRAGYEVTTQFNGTDALKDASANKYDLIMLDIMIPDMDGLEVLRRLRGPDANPKVGGKIIITTNLDLDEETRKVVETLADGYLIKAELTPTELVNMITKFDATTGAAGSSAGNAASNTPGETAVADTTAAAAPAAGDASGATPPATTQPPASPPDQPTTPAA